MQLLDIIFTLIFYVNLDKGASKEWIFTVASFNLTNIIQSSSNDLHGNDVGKS